MLFSEKSLKELKKEYPSSKIVKVTGGYAIFSDNNEYKTWKNQR